MSDVQEEPSGIRGRFLRIPAWAAIRCAPLPQNETGLNRVEVSLKRHRLIPRRPASAGAESRRGAASGFLFDATEKLKPGTVLEMGIALSPGAAEFGMRCLVVAAKRCSSDACRYHVKAVFLSSGEEETAAITQFVKDNYS